MTQGVCVFMPLDVKWLCRELTRNNMPPQSTSPVRWSLKVSAETDIDLRTYLAQHGMRKGDLSKLVEEAVRRDILLRTMNDVATQNATVNPAQIEADIAAALRESSSERLATSRRRRHDRRGH